MIKIEVLVKEGEIQGQEVFLLVLFTENSTFEFTYYKGYSSSWKLSAIILRLYQAIRDGDLILHVIHMAGTRMKAWGVEGLSRGDLLEGMISGEDPFSFIPLAEGANERLQGKVGAWVRSWWKDLDRKTPWGEMPLTEVTKDNLFDLDTVEGPQLWMPPPAAMETIMEVFNEDRMAHHCRAHIFVVPRLMTHLWRKQLGKDSDVLMNIAAGDYFWDKFQHKPLMLIIVLPFAYVETHRGSWIAQGFEKSKTLREEFEAGFKIAGGRNPT